VAPSPPEGRALLVTPGPTVALVGDDEERAALAKVLAAAGFEVDGAEGRDVTVVVAAADADSALAAIRERREAGDQHVVAVAPRELLTPRRALDAGATGVVPLDRAADALAPTIGAVLAGQVAIPLESSDQLERPVLTVREKQTLAMVVLGFSNGEIARKLFVTESTVKSHLGSSFKKLGVTSRKQAVARILDPEGGLGTGILSITGGELIGPEGLGPPPATD
jgi:DNA-binding NarL/FixJ family response regulator